MWSRYFVMSGWAGVVLVAATVTGCGSAPDPRAREREREELRLAWGGGGVRAVPRPQSTAVATGPAPLAYVAQQGGPVSVTDDAGGKWGPVTVGPQGVVRVAEQTGVRIGEVTVDRGPLQPGRIYTVHLGVAEREVFRSGEVQQLDPPKGTTAR